MKKLNAHLGALERQGILKAWHDEKIMPGAYSTQEIAKYLYAARIIILLTSQYFMNSPACLFQMEQSVKRHKLESIEIIHVITRRFYYGGSPLAQFKPLPAENKPIMSWRDQDTALFKVAEHIRLTAESLNSSSNYIHES